MLVFFQFFFQTAQLHPLGNFYFIMNYNQFLLFQIISLERNKSLKEFQSL